MQPPRSIATDMSARQCESFGVDAGERRPGALLPAATPERGELLPSTLYHLEFLRPGLGCDEQLCYLKARGAISSILGQGPGCGPVGVLWCFGRKAGLWVFWVWTQVVPLKGDAVATRTPTCDSCSARDVRRQGVQAGHVRSLRKDGAEASFRTRTKRPSATAQL